MATSLKRHPPVPGPTVTVTAVAPPDTEVIEVAALTADGQVSSGFTFDDERPGDDIDSKECSEPSAAGVSRNTYACGASYLQADACWRRADGDLVCIDRPWDRQLYWRPLAGQLPDTRPAADPTPLGLQLEDGSRYRQRNGPGSGGIAPEDYTDVYLCVFGPCADDPAERPAVLAADGEPAIDTSEDAWTVLIGLLKDAGDEPTQQQPVAMRVTRAWFIFADR